MLLIFASLSLLSMNSTPCVVVSIALFEQWGSTVSLSKSGSVSKNGTANSTVSDHSMWQSSLLSYPPGSATTRLPRCSRVVTVPKGPVALLSHLSTLKLLEQTQLVSRFTTHGP